MMMQSLSYKSKGLQKQFNLGLHVKIETPAHGNCNFVVEGNIITIEATGPWNIEFFKQMHRELAEIISTEVDDKNFAILLILKGDSLAVQDGLDYHLHIVKSGPTKALALNSALSNTPQMTQNIFKKVYDLAGLKNQCFDSTTAAKTWLLAQLAPSNKTN